MRRVLQVVGRWSSPTGLILAGLCFLLPFATVACDTPGGFGRAAPGGTTTYTGVHLVTGAEPDVAPPDKVRPPAQWQDDRLGTQPLAVIVVLLILVGLVAAIVLTDAGLRRGNVATAAGGALILLLLNQAFVTGALANMVSDQITAPLPAGKQVRDYVHTGPGFVFCGALLLVTAVPNAIGWLMLRRAARPQAVPPPYATTSQVVPRY